MIESKAAQREGTPLRQFRVLFGILVAFLGCLFVEQVEARPGVRIGLPGAVDGDLNVLEDRLTEAVENSGISLTRAIPGVEWREGIPSDMLQTNLIMGIQDFYNSDFDSAERKLRIALEEMRRHPKTLRGGLVSLVQIQEGAISLSRALMERGETRTASRWLQWLVFTLPNARIGLDKYPPAIVSEVEKIRESFEEDRGRLEWRTPNPLENCRLWLNGTRSFSQKEVTLPVGEYQAEVRCGNAMGWTRTLQVFKGQTAKLAVAPEAESRLDLTREGVRFREWPPTRDLLRDLSSLLGRDVVFPNRIRLKDDDKDYFAFQRISPSNELETLAWTEYPDGSFEPTDSPVLRGTLPASFTGATARLDPGPSAWTWSAYGLGSALLIAGAVTNVMAEQSEERSVSVFNTQRDQRAASLALYGAGALSVVGGILLHVLVDSTTPHQQPEASHGQ